MLRKEKSSESGKQGFGISRQKRSADSGVFDENLQPTGNLAGSAEAPWATGLRET